MNFIIIRQFRKTILLYLIFQMFIWIDNVIAVFALHDCISCWMLQLSSSHSHITPHNQSYDNEVCSKIACFLQLQFFDEIENRFSFRMKCTSMARNMTQRDTKIHLKWCMFCPYVVRFAKIDFVPFDFLPCENESECEMRDARMFVCACAVCLCIPTINNNMQNYHQMTTGLYVMLCRDMHHVMQSLFRECQCKFTRFTDTGYM